MTLLVGSTVLAYNPAQVKPGYLGLGVVVLLAVATFFLVRSMNKQLRKIKIDDGSREHEAGDGDDANERGSE